MEYVPYQGTSGDNMGVNGMEIVCRGPGMNGTREWTAVQNQDSIGFGFSAKWSSLSPSCPPGSAVCALTTKVKEWAEDEDDDSAVVDAVLHCC